jgi:hypothetical protein
MRPADSDCWDPAQGQKAAVLNFFEDRTIFVPPRVLSVMRLQSVAIQTYSVQSRDDLNFH